MKVNIDGVTLEIASADGLKEAIKTELQKVEQRLEKVEKERITLKHQRRALKALLDGRPPRKPTPTPAS